MLTTEQLTELFFHSATRGKTRLVALYRLGLLDRFQPWRPGGGSWSYHYVLGREGAAVLAAERGEDPDRAARRWRPDKALAIGRTQRLAHYTGVNGIFVGLAAHARQAPDARLAAWMTERECAAWTEGIVRPDAFGEWREKERSVEFLLEYDRGTENLARLADKLTGYERLEAERGVASWILFVFPSPRREDGARRVLARATVAVATASLASPSKPHEAVWLPTSASAPRLRLAELADAPKPPEALRRAATGGPRAWRFDRSDYDIEEAPIGLT